MGWRVRTRLLTLACSICCSAAARVFWSGDMQFISSGVTSIVPTSCGLTYTRESPARCRTASVSAAQIVQVGAWLRLASSAQWVSRTGSTRRALACTLTTPQQHRRAAERTAAAAAVAKC